MDKHSDENNHRLEDIIDRKYQNILDKYNERTPLVNFSPRNSSVNPIPDHTWGDSYHLTNLQQVTNIFKKIKKKTSTGFDGIPNIVLANLPMKIVKVYTILFNNILNNTTLPDKWKVAKVIPIQKKGKIPAQLQIIGRLI